MKSEFGRALRDLRAKHGVSLRDLADTLGCSHVRLGEVEQGKRVVPAGARQLNHSERRPR